VGFGAHLPVVAGAIGELPQTSNMGACVSSSENAEGDQKKRSQAIDRNIEEDSKKLRRECKILLLGRWKDDVTKGKLVARTVRALGCIHADNAILRFR
jgi:hypothetical protein